MFAVSLNCALIETNMDNKWWGVIYNKSTYASASVYFVYLFLLFLTNIILFQILGIWIFCNIDVYNFARVVV
jgi:hypothetical protein